MNNCCLVCVTYNPDVNVLLQVISASVDQVERFYVIDNGSTTPVGALVEKFEAVEVVSLEENKGIAVAFNVGIRLAQKAGYQYVMLLDQDSILPDGALLRYLEVMEQQRVNGSNIAALGPRYRNPETGHTSLFVRYNWFRNSFHKNEKSSLLVAADFLISSGSFYDIRIFDSVGLFNEGLFIDHVDTEWCHRAKNLGFKCIGLWDVIMTHSLGEDSLRFWLLRWHVQPLHKSFRLYYIFRNSLLLYRLPHVPFQWISGDICRLFRLFFIYCLFSKDRVNAIKWIYCGMRDGVLARRGKVM